MNALLKLSLFFTLILSSEARYFDTVIIDPGHGGRDKGAYWGGVRESYLNMIVANKLAYELKARGIKTVLTRTTDKTLSKSSRIYIANKYPRSIVVSVHFNAHLDTSIKGLETFYISSEGKKMARAVQGKLARSLKVRDRGIKQRRFAMLVGPNAPSILVECGFISNPSERARASTRWYQTTAARVIAEGLMEYRKMK